ncbi:MAG: hypothetical protein ACLGJD_17550 [Gammaproteobacteria bacterium]
MTQTAPASLPVLARQLHARGDETLEIELPAGSTGVSLAGEVGVVVDGSTLRFASLAELNRIVAADAARELGPVGLADQARLFPAAKDLWRHEIGHADQASGRLLATAAAAGVDVLRLAAGALGDRRRVFDVLHVIEAMLPYFDELPLDSLLALNDAQFELTRGDLAAGMFFGRLQAWLQSHRAAADRLLELLMVTPTEQRAQLIGATWQACFASEPAAAADALLAAADRREAPLPAVITWLAGRMLQDARIPPELATRLDALLLQRLASGEQPERNAALEATSGLLHLRRSFDDVLLARANARDQDALAHIAIALSQHGDALRGANLFFQWLAPCIHLGEKYEGALDRLDYTLSRLLHAEDPEREATLAFLLAWVESQPFAGANDGRFTKLFNLSAADILNSPPLRARVVTQWLLADSKHAAAAVASLLSGVRRTQPMELAFDAELLAEVPDSDLLYLTRRLIGYVIDPEQLLSLALSLLAVPDAPRRVFPFMRSLLIDEIGYDYPGTTIRRLEAVLPTVTDAGTRELLEEIERCLQADIAQLDGLPRLKELAPPPALRRAFVKARAKQMEEAMASAQAGSILQQLVTRVHLKGGEGSFQYMPEVQRYTEPMKLKSMSYSFELPRRESLDPVGNAYRMHLNRSTKRKPT